VANEAAFDHAAFEEFRAGLLRHIGLEEKLLLLHARAKKGAPLPITRTLRVEHAALASLLVPTPDRALVGEIEGLLERHNQKEEGDAGLYAECAALGPKDEDGELLERMRATPPPPLAKHFDGKGAHRSAAAALAAAEKSAKKSATRAAGR
jgi:hypothetical protein